jgi:hypothetical protein
MKRIILSIAVLVMASCAAERYTVDQYSSEFDAIIADTTTYEMDETEALMEVLANADFTLEQQRIAYETIERFPNDITERDVVMLLEAFNGSVDSTMNYLIAYKGENMDWVW